MSFNLKVTGSVTNNVAEVDVNNNLKVNLPITEAQGGFASLTSEIDAGTVTGTRYNKALEVSDDYRLRIGQDNMIFNECFPGTAVNTALWSTTLTTMTNTVASGFSNLNAGGSIAAAAVANQRTYRHFPCYKQYSTYFEMEVQLSTTPQTGNRCEWGAMLVATTAIPTDGAFFRLTEGGLFYGVMNYNGSETQTAALTLPAAGTTHSYLIYVHSQGVEFWIDNILHGEIQSPSAQGASLTSMNVPVAFRNYNVTAASTAQVMKIGNVNVTWGDQAMSKPWGHVISGTGGHSTQGQTGGTMGSTAIITNAATAAAAAVVNVSAAAQFVGLGGYFNVLPTLTAGSDGILCSYQVPVGTAALPGKSLYVTGIVIDGVVTTILAGGPVIYAVGIAYGSTNVSLATTESAVAKAPRRLALGIQSYAATAAVGAQGQHLQDDYTCAPICVQPGEFFQVTLRNFGTVTTTGAITFAVGITGYWE
jgi:hypothetical protein